jgi:5-methylcytosine-specific restriction endonuclease McrA
LCGLKIDAQKQKWEVDHVIPLWLNGADAENNMRPLHVHCHAAETAAAAPVRAKSNRQREKHLGLRKAKGRPMPGTKASGIRKRMSGRVEKW